MMIHSDCYVSFENNFEGNKATGMNFDPRSGPGLIPFKARLSADQMSLLKKVADLFVMKMKGMMIRHVKCVTL